MIEKSYMPKGETDPNKPVTEKMYLSSEEALGVIFGAQKGVEQNMEKLADKNRERAASSQGRQP
jgi:hypothetical protein